VHDGAVLPILHLNGYKIANPRFWRGCMMPNWKSLFHGYGYQPQFVEGDDPEKMHQQMAATLDTALAEIKGLQNRARTGGLPTLVRWPMIVLRSPKGWTGPKVVDGKQVEGTFRAHQVPLSNWPRSRIIFGCWKSG